MATGLSQSELQATLQSAFETALQGIGEKVLTEVRVELRCGLQNIRSVVETQKSVSPHSDAHSERPSSPAKGHSGAFSSESSCLVEDGSPKASADYAEQPLPLSDSYSLLPPEHELSIEQWNESRSIWNNEGFWIHFVKSEHFECGVGLIVLANAFCLGLETNADCMYNMHPPDFETSIYKVAEFVFMLLFLFEWMTRLCIFGRSWLEHEKWYIILFDTSMVAFQVFEQAVTLLSLKATNLKELRILRILRLMRILRVIRLLHLFADLALLVDSILAGVSTLCWSLALLFMGLYACSVFFARMALQATEGTYSPRLTYFFGNVPRTFLTVLESIIGGLSWDEPCMVLINEVNLGTGVVFCIYITIALFVLLNVVTGVFIDKAMKTADKEAEEMAVSAISEAFAYEIDQGHVITWARFEQKLHEPEMVRYLEEINIKPDDAEELFTLIDADGSGTISASELVKVCETLKRPARSIDMAQLMQEFGRNTGGLHEKMKSLEGGLKVIHEHHGIGSQVYDDNCGTIAHAKGEGIDNGKMRVLL